MGCARPWPGTYLCGSGGEGGGDDAAGSSELLSALGSARSAVRFLVVRFLWPTFFTLLMRQPIRFCMRE